MKTNKNKQETIKNNGYLEELKVLMLGANQNGSADKKRGKK